MTSKEIMELQQEVMTEIIECQESEIKLLKEKADLQAKTIEALKGLTEELQIKLCDMQAKVWESGEAETEDRIACKHCTHCDPSRSDRKKAEIERLQKENKILSRNADTAFQDGLNERRELFAPEIKAEAYKEFAERLKDYAEECIKNGYDGIGKQDIDNLLKEIEGAEE